MVWFMCEINKSSEMNNQRSVPQVHLRVTYCANLKRRTFLQCWIDISQSEWRNFL